MIRESCNSAPGGGAPRNLRPEPLPSGSKRGPLASRERAPKTCPGAALTKEPWLCCAGSAWLARVDGAGLLGAGREEWLRSAGNQQVRLVGGADARGSDRSLLYAVVIAPDQLRAIGREAWVKVQRLGDLRSGQLDHAALGPIGGDVVAGVQPQPHGARL